MLVKDGVGGCNFCKAIVIICRAGSVLKTGNPVPMCCIIEGIDKCIGRLPWVSIIVIGINDIELALESTYGNCLSRITTPCKSWHDTRKQNGTKDCDGNKCFHRTVNDIIFNKKIVFSGVTN